MIETRISLKQLEERIWQDIAQARASFEIIKSFLRPLYLRSNSYFKNRDVPLTNAIWVASFDSLVMALSRLLELPAKSSGCTLAIFRNRVVSELRQRKPKNNGSDHSRQCYEKLSDRNFLRQFKEKHEELWKRIEPLRNKLIAHSDSGFDPKLLKEYELYLGGFVDFVEDVHRTCRSALDDASIPGPYISSHFQEVVQDWLQTLTKRVSDRAVLNKPELANR